MVRVFLKAYSEMDCANLYNALYVALSSLPANSRPAHDIESAMNYIIGYSDAMQDKRLQKEGVPKCPHV